MAPRYKNSEVIATMTLKHSEMFKSAALQSGATVHRSGTT